MRTPLVTVVMPVYNTDECFLRESIDSILGQTMRDFELFVVDDNSRGHVGKIVKSYSDPRIRYEKFSENRGVSVARNHAIDNSVSKFVAFVDSDDKVYPTKLADQIEFFKQHPEVGCLGTYVDVLQYQNNGKKTLNKENFKRFTSERLIELFHLFGGSFFCQSSVMVRRDVLNEGYRYKQEATSAEDYEFFLGMIGKVKFAILPKVLGLYRSHPSNLSHTQKETQKANARKYQMEAVQRFLSVRFSEKDELVFETLQSGKIGNRISVGDIESFVERISDKLNDRNYGDDEISFAVGDRFKNLFHYAKSKTHLKDLFKSKLNRRFGISLPWRLFYFVKNRIKGH